MKRLRVLYSIEHHTVAHRQSCGDNTKMMARSAAVVSARHSYLQIGLRRHIRCRDSHVTARFLSEQSSKPGKNLSKAVVPMDSGESSVPAIPIDFDVSSKVEGDESQICTVDLRRGQILRAESGAMIYMTSGIQMETTTGGGVSEGFKRMLTGQNMFISDFTYTGDGKGSVALGTDFPSKIVKLNLADYNRKIVCQRGAYLASNPTVDIEMEFTKKFSTGFFGGEGFVLQALTGEGDVFVKAGGTLVKKELDENETIRISSGSLVAFSGGIQYDIQTMPGFKNVMFGGEGLFVTTLTGPGTVWLQGMPPDRMISEIARRVPSRGGIGLGIPIGMGGGTAENGGTEDANIADTVGLGDGESGQDGVVAATDAAANMDRQATVASSGLMGGTDSPIGEADSESSTALFGDAAPSDAAPPDDSFSSESEGIYQDNSFTPDVDETSSFSTEDDFPNEFKDDDTTFSTFQDQQGEADSFGDGGVDDDGDGVGSVLKSLWDFFTDED